jgi:hypothetical protein
MAVLWQYYLGIAVGTVVLVGFLITKAPILLIPVAGIWLYYAMLRCPSCKMFIKANRMNWWRPPSTTCLKCGRDLTKP